MSQAIDKNTICFFCTFFLFIILILYNIALLLNCQPFTFKNNVQFVAFCKDNIVHQTAIQNLSILFIRLHNNEGIPQATHGTKDTLITYILFFIISSFPAIVSQHNLQLHRNLPVTNLLLLNIFP